LGDHVEIGFTAFSGDWSHAQSTNASMGAHGRDLPRGGKENDMKYPFITNRKMLSSYARQNAAPRYQIR
jgi:hypothetical protein